MNFGTLLYQFTVDLMLKIVNLTDILYESLFWSIRVNNTEISLWALIGGVGFASLFLIQIVKLLAKWGGRFEECIWFIIWKSFRDF